MTTAIQSSSRNVTTRAIAVAYLLIIILTFWYAKEDEKKLYDRFLVTLEGGIIPVAQETRSADFYGRILEFMLIKHPDVKTGGEAIGFSLPGSRRFIFEKAQGKDINPQRYVVRVRNGIDELHQALNKKLEIALERPGMSGKISELTIKPWGNEFTVTDPDGNELIFFLPARRSSIRLPR